MFKVQLQKGSAYYDPKTKTNLSLSKNIKTFTDDMIENLDMSGINYAVKVGVLKKLETETSTEENTEEEVEGEIFQEGEDVEPLTAGLDEFTEDGEPRCQSLTADGSQCKNPAKYPEENPEYCGTHKYKLEE